MRNLNKQILKNEIEKKIVYDKYDLPVYVCKNLKIDILNVFKRYGIVDEEALKLNVKVLSSNKYIIQIDCLVDNFFYTNLHI